MLRQLFICFALALSLWSFACKETNPDFCDDDGDCGAGQMCSGNECVAKPDATADAGDTGVDTGVDPPDTGVDVPDAGMACVWDESNWDECLWQ